MVTNVLAKALMDTTTIVNDKVQTGACKGKEGRQAEAESWRDASRCRNLAESTLTLQAGSQV
jgi:hypothetical protein